MVMIKTVLIMMMNGSRTSMEGCQGGDEGVLSIVINDPKLFLKEPLFFFKSNKKQSRFQRNNAFLKFLRKGCKL